MYILVHWATPFSMLLNKLLSYPRSPDPFPRPRNKIPRAALRVQKSLTAKSTSSLKGGSETTRNNSYANLKTLLFFKTTILHFFETLKKTKIFGANQV